MIWSCDLYLLFNIICLWGEGVPGKLSFFVKTYIVALVILFSKWAHLPLNSKRLWRYEAAKLGRFRAFSTLSIGKSAKMALKISSVINFFQHWDPLGPPFWVLWQHLTNIYKITEGILKILIYWVFMATFSPNFGQNWQNRSKFELKMAIKSQKIKIFKIPSVIL